jgi:hypothetical protein
LRQGRKLDVLSKFRGLDTVQLATRVIEEIQKHDPDLTVIDGDGIGAGVIDTLRDRGFGKRLHEFHGGATPDDTKQYFNKRAEAWGLLREALKEGIEIPDDPEMETDLTGIQYGFSSKQQIQLERKEDMKKRGLSSPDLGDMAAMTFAVKVQKRDKPKPQMMNRYGEAGWMA